MPSTYSCGEDRGGCHFLRLPRELRDRIYELLLDFESPPPGDPDKDPERCAMNPEDGRNLLIMISTLQRPPPNSSGSLLCSNRQVSTELSHTLFRYDITYNLDLLFDSTPELLSHPTKHNKVICYPTWTKLPASLKHLKYLDVNIRLCSWTMLWTPWCNTMPVGRVLLHLLGRGFLYGPSFTPSSSPCEAFFVQEMRINVDEDYTNKPSIWTSTQRQTSFTELPDFLRQIARAGVLAGKLGAISFYWHGQFRDRWVIEASDTPSNALSEWAVQTGNRAGGSGFHGELVFAGIPYSIGLSMSDALPSL
ncbi:MAG: hypothetical protein Q9169_004332 [Polycauliona sp. 2 TL-2023]